MPLNKQKACPEGRAGEIRSRTPKRGRLISGRPLFPVERGAWMSHPLRIAIGAIYETVGRTSVSRFPAHGRRLVVRICNTALGETSNRSARSTVGGAYDTTELRVP